MRRITPLLVCIVAAMSITLPMLGQEAAAPPAEMQKQTMLDLLMSGGPVGIVLILLSFAGAAMVFDGFRKLNPQRLIPPDVVVQYRQMVEKARFAELLSVSKAQDTLISRIVTGGMSQGSWGIDAVREGMQQAGEQEIANLRHRIGHISLLAAIAPMLGLLGTVVGMIASFRTLGERGGAATPDELAVGISVALITTCMGLVIAIPLMVCHAVLRNRVASIGQQAAAECERLTRIMSVIIEQQRQVPPAVPRPATPNHSPAGSAASRMMPAIPSPGGAA